MKLLAFLALIGFAVASFDFNVEKNYGSMDDCMNGENVIFQRSRYAVEEFPCDEPTNCQEVGSNIFSTISCESEMPKVPENHPHVTYGYFEDAQCEELYFGIPEGYKEDSYVTTSVAPNVCQLDTWSGAWFTYDCNQGITEGKICADSACSIDCSDFSVNPGCTLGHSPFYPADSYTKIQCGEEGGNGGSGGSADYYVFVLYRTLFSQLRNLEGFLAMNDEFKDSRVFTVIYEEQNGMPDHEKVMIAYGDEYLHCSPKECSFKSYPPMNHFGFEIVKEDEDDDTYFYQYQMNGNGQKRYLAFDDKFFLTQRSKFAILMKAVPVQMEP